MKKIFATIALIAIGSMAFTYAQNNSLLRPDDPYIIEGQYEDWDGQRIMVCLGKGDKFCIVDY